MRKFVLSVLVSIVMAIGLVSARPLVINADATDGEFDNDSVVGVQVQEDEELLSGVQGTRYTFNIILDGFYIGEFNIHVEYDSYNLDSSDWDHYTINRTVYVCGYDTYFETWMRENWLPPSSITWSASVNNSDQCIYVGRMDSLQLLNTLIQFKNTYSSNSAVTNGFLNQLDQKIDLLTRIRSYDIPFESLLVISYFNYYHEPEDLYMNGVYDFKYPVYKMDGNSFRLYGYKDHQYKLIMLCKSSSSSEFNNVFSITPSNGYALTSSVYRSGFTYFYKNTWFYFMTFTFTCSANGNYVFSYNGNDQKYYVVPIYYGDVQDKNISTDFALQFGLSNQLLDDLHIIAQGNQQSNSSSSDLEDSANEYGELADDVLGLEDDLGSGFSSSLNNVPTTFNFSTQFGNKFLHSATWVRTQFETLTTNTPFGALITFSLVLGLALLLVGRRLL